MERPLVIVADGLTASAMAWLAERAEIVEAAPGEAAFIDAIERAEGLVVRTRTGVDEALLDSADRLVVVGRAGVGIDHIDIEACGARGVEVVSTPGANRDAVVEFTLACMLDAYRPRLFLERGMGRAAWEDLRSELVAERELSELALGIVGFGRIGSRLGELCSSIGMRVRFCDIREVDSLNAERVDLEELIRSSDVVSVHVDGRASNRGLIGRGVVGMLKPDALLINTSRGHVVDVVALAGFLREHPDARSIVDVHEPEPIRTDHPLLGLPNAFLTAHIAGGTRRAKEAMAMVVRDVWKVIERRRAGSPG